MGASFLLIALFGTIPAAISLWLLFRVVKAAVREGIKESGLIESMRTAKREPTAEAHTQPMRVLRAD